MNIEKRELEVRLKHAKILIEIYKKEVGIYKKEVESLKEEIDKLKNHKTVIDKSDFDKLKDFFDIDMNSIDSIEKFIGRLVEDYCPSEFGLIDYDCHDGCDKCWERHLERILEKDEE